MVDLDSEYMRCCPDVDRIIKVVSLWKETLLMSKKRATFT